MYNKFNKQNSIASRQPRLSGALPRRCCRCHHCRYHRRRSRAAALGRGDPLQLPMWARARARALVRAAHVKESHVHVAMCGATLYA